MSIFTSSRTDRGYVVRPVTGLRGVPIYQAMPTSPGVPGVAQGSPKFTVQRTQTAISSTEQLRFVNPGSTGVSTVAGDPGPLVGLTLALRAHLDALVTGGWWTGGRREFAVRLRDALAALPLNAEGVYNAQDVKAALLSMPVTHRDALDASITSATLPTAARMGGYTTARMLSDIAAGRYTRSAPSSGGINPNALRSDVSGRGAGGGSGGSLVDSFLSARRETGPARDIGGGGTSIGPTTDVMPTVTPEAMDEMRRQSDPNAIREEPAGIPWRKYVPAALGFAAGLGLLLLRR